MLYGATTSRGEGYVTATVRQHLGSAVAWGQGCASGAHGLCTTRPCDSIAALSGSSRVADARSSSVSARG